jgi:hypothetical protein
MMKYTTEERKYHVSKAGGRYNARVVSVRGIIVARSYRYLDGKIDEYLR